MNIGLCLCGGGAKGAYQAGVIKALYDRGINKFNAISGTSIGAVNGYFIFTNNVEKLEEMSKIAKKVSKDLTLNNYYLNFEKIMNFYEVNFRHLSFYVRIEKKKENH